MRGWEAAAWAEIGPNAALREVLTQALAAVEPGAAVRRWLRRTPAGLGCGDGLLAAPGQPLGVLAVGKAAPAMAQAAVAVAGDWPLIGLVVAPAALMQPCPPLRALPGDHPWPGQASLAAGQALLDWADALPAGTPTLVLLSGGASALLATPAPGLSLADVQATTTALSYAGAPIGALNCVRKHLEQLKGGGLAARLRGPVVSLVLSDVVGSDLAVIASGPTVPDPTTFADALAVLRAHPCALPAAALAHVQAGAAGVVPDTPKASAALWQRVTNHCIGDNGLALAAAEQAASRLGWAVERLAAPFEGEARLVGADLARRLLAAGARPRLLLAGGETTVRLADPASAAGQGGRNQELALAAAQVLDGHARVALLAVATDGADGPTPAAGALATGTTLARARALGLDAAGALARHHTYPLWAALGDAFAPGPTGTNVNDLVLGFAW